MTAATARDRRPLRSEPRDASDLLTPRPWQSLYVAPLAFAAHLGVAYPLVPWVCGNQHHGVLHLVSALFLVVALFGVVQGWRGWRGRRDPAASDAGDGDAQRHFLAVIGTLLSALYALGIAAQWFTAFVVPPCVS